MNFKEQVIQFFQGSEGARSERALQTALKLNTAEERQLGRLALRELEAEGTLVRNERGDFAFVPEERKVRGRLQGHRKGFAFLIREDGQKPDLFVAPGKLNGAIHGDLVLPPHRHIPFAALSPELAEHCIICTSPSKTFNLAGLLVSDIIIPSDEIRSAFRKKMAPYYLWPGNFGTAAQIAAYTQGGPWLDQLLEYLAGNARYIAGFLAQNLPRVKYRVPEATYLAWLDCRDLGLSPEALWDRVLHQAKVAPDNGVLFGPQGEGDGFLRLNFACPRAQLQEALTRMAEALGAL